MAQLTRQFCQIRGQNLNSQCLAQCELLGRCVLKGTIFTAYYPKWNSKEANIQGVSSAVPRLNILATLVVSLCNLFPVAEALLFPAREMYFSARVHMKTHVNFHRALRSQTSK